MAFEKLRQREHRKELGQPELSPEVLGTISANSRTITDNAPEPVEWVREDGTTMSIREELPPWEVRGPDGKIDGDARRFVEVPPNWRLHWVNSRLLESEGWRDYQPVMASDPRVKVRVPSMISPEGYVRRGGPNGDILAWMWMGWYLSRRKQTIEKIRLQGQAAADKQQNLVEESKRGAFGPFVGFEGGKTPTHTAMDGRQMERD